MHLYLVAIFQRRCVDKRPQERFIWQTGMPLFVVLLVLIQQTRELLNPSFLQLTVWTCDHLSQEKQQILLVKIFQPVTVPKSVVIIRLWLHGMLLQAGWTGPQYPNQTNPAGGIKVSQNCGKTVCLYSIMEDHEEWVNLAEKEPDTLKMMQQKLAKYHFNPERGKAWPGACNTAVNTYIWRILGAIFALKSLSLWSIWVSYAIIVVWFL